MDAENPYQSPRTEGIRFASQARDLPSAPHSTEAVEPKKRPHPALWIILALGLLIAGVATLAGFGQLAMLGLTLAGIGLFWILVLPWEAPE